MSHALSAFESKLVHAGIAKDVHGSVVPPIYQTSTFAFESAQQGADRFAGKADGFIYTRLGIPRSGPWRTALRRSSRGPAASPRRLAWGLSARPTSQCCAAEITS